MFFKSRNKKKDVLSSDQRAVNAANQYQILHQNKSPLNTFFAPFLMTKSCREDMAKPPVSELADSSQNQSDTVQSSLMNANNQNLNQPHVNNFTSSEIQQP